MIDGQWYAPYVLAGAREGLFDIEPVYGLVHPHMSVSRTEFLKMMTIAFDLTTNVPYQYQDIPREAWYRPYVGVAYRYGLFPDRQNPLKFHPDLRVTHAEGIAAVAAILKYVPHLHPLTEEQLTKLLQREVLFRPSAPGMLTAPVFPTGQTVQIPSRSATTPSMVKQAMLKLFSRNTDAAAETKLNIIQRVNAKRRAVGLPIMTFNAQLGVAAQNHARDMFTRGYFGHFNPEGDSYVDRIRHVGYMDEPLAQCPCQPIFDLKNASFTPNSVIVKSGNLCDCSVQFSVGENIARGQLTAAQVMEDWMQSPSHKRNILESEFKEIGVGIFGDVWVQNFGHAELEEK